MNYRILLGNSPSGNERIWDSSFVSNPHMLLTGISGSGKTNALQNYCLQAAKQEISSIILDLSNSFSRTTANANFYSKAKGFVKYSNLLENGISINPLLPIQYKANEKVAIESYIQIADRICDQLTSSFKLAPLERSFIYGQLKEYLASPTFTQKSLQHFMTGLSDKKEKTCRTFLSKTESFFDKAFFSDTKSLSWNQIVNGFPQMLILDLSGLNENNQKILSDFIIQDILNYGFSTPNREKPFILIVDECQLLRISQSSPISRLLTEGRKYNIWAWFSTQFINDKLNPYASLFLEQAATSIYFRQASSDIRRLAKKLDPQNIDKLISMFQNLSPGDCITQTPCNLRDKVYRLTVPLL